MAFEVSELKLTGIDERNLATVHAYEEYLTGHLPSSEVIRDMFIDLDIQPLLSDLYFFTDGLMIEIPDFVTFYDGKYHSKKMNFLIHPIRKNVIFFNQKITQPSGSTQRTVEVSFRLKTGANFTFTEMKENSLKLEYIAKTYLVPNLATG